MGLFDEIVCDYPLPGTPPEFIGPGHRFQTKDLDCDMSTYRIAEDGAFDLPDFTGTINFGASNIRGSGAAVYTTHGEDAEDVDYRVTIVKGRLTDLVETHRTRRPAFPVAEMQYLRERPSDEDVQRWEEREAEPLLGRRIYVLWGGSEVGQGYWAEVVHETFGRRGKLCVTIAEVEEGAWQHSGDLELLDRSSRDRTHFDSPEDAARIRGAKKTAWEAEEARYEALVASREAAS